METLQIPRGHEAAQVRRRSEVGQMLPPDPRRLDRTGAKQLQITVLLQIRITRRESSR
jgi:hypothetical protein